MRFAQTTTGFRREHGSGGGRSIGGGHGSNGSVAPLRAPSSTTPLPLPLPAWRAPKNRRGRCARYADERRERAAVGEGNPLERLRGTDDPRERARLLQALDARWAEHAEAYSPSAAEAAIAEGLGVPRATVMMFALQTPALQAYDVEEQVKPAVRTLRAALAEAPRDAYFALTRRPDLLAAPRALSRWLDFLSAHAGASAQHGDVLSFVLAAPLELLEEGTLHGAAKVVAWLRAAGVKEDFLWSRVVCACPAVLLADPEAQLDTVAAYLRGRLGLSSEQLARLACARPELLARPPAATLQPFASVLRSLGASDAQAGEVLLAAPALALRGEGASAALAPRLTALAAVGVDRAGVAAMLAKGETRFLTEPGAPGDALAALREVGYEDTEVCQLVLACPAILSERPLELRRKAAFLTDTLVMSLADALAWPGFYAASLMQTLGPRHAFAESRGLEGRLRATASRSDGAWDLRALADGSDAAFADALGASVNEYSGFRSTFETKYNDRLSADAQLEFEAELKKLGLWGPDS